MSMEPVFLLQAAWEHEPGTKFAINRVVPNSNWIKLFICLKRWNLTKSFIE